MSAYQAVKSMYQFQPCFQCIVNNSPFFLVPKVKSNDPVTYSMLFGEVFEKTGFFPGSFLRPCPTVYCVFQGTVRTQMDLLFSVLCGGNQKIYGTLFQHSKHPSPLSRQVLISRAPLHGGKEQKVAFLLKGGTIFSVVQTKVNYILSQIIKVRTRLIELHIRGKEKCETEREREKKKKTAEECSFHCMYWKLILDISVRNFGSPGQNFVVKRDS